MLDEAARNKEAVLELELVKVELAEECRRCVELEKMLEELGLNSSTPVVPARRMMSTDPLGSATNVESLDGYMLTGREPKAVQEVDEDEGPYSDQENHLVGYEGDELPPAYHHPLAHLHLHLIQHTLDIICSHASGPSF